MKYAGYTRKQLRTLIKASRKSGEGLDSLFEDAAITCDVIEALLKHLKELSPPKEKAKVSGTAKAKAPKPKTKTKTRATKKVVKFPTFD